MVSPGTGLDLAAPLKFNHAANLPFSDRGTGISFQPATAFAHSSNEPVQALGAGITLDSPLASNHYMNAAVRDAAVTTAGYQGTPAPNQWFGGPELTTTPFFGRTITVKKAAWCCGMPREWLSTASTMAVSSIHGRPRATRPWPDGSERLLRGIARPGGFGPEAAAGTTNSSAGRFPDGADTGSNCTDFLSGRNHPAIPIGRGRNQHQGRQCRRLCSGPDHPDRYRNKPGNSRDRNDGYGRRYHATAATSAGATMIPVGYVVGFSAGQTITIDAGANSETAVIASVNGWDGPTITLAAPLSRTHDAGAQVSGSGINLATALTKTHSSGTQVTDNLPTPGAPNRYYIKAR